MAVNTNRYQKAMNSVCDTHFPMKAAEMLEKAKKAADPKNITDHDEKEVLNMKMTQKSNENIILRVVAGITVTAACMGIAGALGYAVFSMKRNIAAPPAATTSITAKNTEAGTQTTEPAAVPGIEMIHIGKERSDELLTIRLDSITGDTLSPKLLWDVTVRDAEVAAKYDRIQLSAFILDEENYANHMDEYCMCEAYGEKDSEVDNLYHVCMDGASAFMQRNSQVVAAVKQVLFQNGSGTSEVRNVNMEYRFTVPDTMRESTQVFPSGITLSSGNVDYDLFLTEFGAYETLFQFEFDYLDSKLAGGKTDYSEVEDFFDKDWQDYAKNMVLTVDGTAFAPTELGCSYYNEDKAVCSTWLSFPGVDYEAADQIILTSGGQTYQLKKDQNKTEQQQKDFVPENESKIGMEQSNDLLTVRLNSIAGDSLSPKILWDVTVKDAALAADNSRIQLSAYILDEETYANHMDEYAMCEGYGEKDPDVNNLYHICMDAPSYFMSNWQQLVVAVRQVYFDHDNVKHQNRYSINLEYLLTIPEGALKEQWEEEYSDIKVSSKNADYALVHGEYGSYNSYLRFNFVFKDSPLAKGAGCYEDVMDRFNRDWNKLINDFVLIVDGTEFTPDDLVYGTDCYSETEGLCSTWVSFPGFDYENAKQVSLKVGEQIYTLKNGNS